MQLNFIHFIEQLPTKKNYVSHSVSSAEVEKTGALLAEDRGKGQEEIGGGDLK